MEPQHSEQHDAPAAVPVTDATKPAADNSDHKLFAILGYILPFLFFLPLLNDKSKHNAFARFHANQQLILLILGIGVHFLATPFLFMLLGYGGYMFSSLLNLALLVFVILGVINAAQDEMKELPLIGGFKLLK
jgi:uncharacterized membrane protein